LKHSLSDILNSLNGSSILFFTGYGSALNVDGEVEMDAIVMEGKELKTGMYGWLTCLNSREKQVCMCGC
jgi:isoaspartyl peptidase/L-asparaginase-like protein (Ntn-hydrolase superfamily)